MTYLDKENCAQQYNQGTQRRTLDRDLVSNASGSGSRAGSRARPRTGTGMAVVGGGSRGSRSRERSIVDRGGSGDTHGRGAILDREIITSNGIAKFGGRDVGGNVEELYARIGGRSGRGNEARGLSIDEEGVSVRASALRWAVHTQGDSGSVAVKRDESLRRASVGNNLGSVA